MSGKQGMGAAEPKPAAVVVTTRRQLDDVCGRLRARRSFALDTEFVRERTYFVRLGIVQVATRELEAIVDPQAVESLEPLFDLVGDADVEKVVHAGEQDLTLFFERTGKPAKNVFDTQIAAALVGYGEQLSYARLVERTTGIRLAKLETLTDWTARPLTPAQIAYALEDVRHLVVLREHLGNRLRALGRESWAREETRHLEELATYAPAEPRRLYERIPASGLDSEQLGVLRELASWREQEAMRRDIPRGWVLRDPILVEIARRRPTSEAGLRLIRSLGPREIEKDGAGILAAVRRGKADPVQDEGPDLMPPEIEEQAKPIVRLLDAWLHERAASAEIGPRILASREELQALVAGHLVGRIPDLPVLSGWRHQIVGDDLVGLLCGKISLRVEAGGGPVRVVKEGPGISDPSLT